MSTASPLYCAEFGAQLIAGRSLAHIGTLCACGWRRCLSYLRPLFQMAVTYPAANV